MIHVLVQDHQTVGSSPRVRGTAVVGQRRGNYVWFIPAGAGNSLSVQKRRPKDSVHPRGCGEQSSSGHRYRPALGSSPRVRGTVVFPVGIGQGDGLVHPRGCGEQETTNLITNTYQGSSPRVRGTEVVQAEERDLQRFIPAGAGNSARWTNYSRACQVHPRGCGEQTQCTVTLPLPTGSSPRVRGTVPARPRSVRSCWFIPAGAGNRKGVQTF